MIRYLLLMLTAMLMAVPTLATPQFDPASHPYIQLISTSHAVEKIGTPSNVLVYLRNPGTSAIATVTTVSIYLNTALVGQSSYNSTIQANSTLPVIYSQFTILNAGDRGYRVDVTVRDTSGNTLDAGTGAIDVQADAFNDTFPRQCWVSKWDTSINTTALAQSLTAWHCNTVQGYALYYRPELAPSAGLATWNSLSNLTVSRATIQSMIAQAHARNMPVLFFQATGEAYSNWTGQSVKPSLAWGSFDTTCGLTNSCAEANLDRSPISPDNWTQYGWQTDHLEFFDPCNAGWQQFLISNSIGPMLSQFGFDGWQADTVGAPLTANGITYDARGNPIDTKACLGDFTSGAAERLGKPVILNNVSGWGLIDTAFAGNQPYLYRETWDYDTPYYPGLNSIISDSTYGVRRYSHRPIIEPGYLQRTLATNCSTGTQTLGCFVNPNSPLLATAMFAISGSTFMDHADDDCILTNVFVEGPQLSCSAATVNSLLAYKAFEVGYENMLRDSAFDSVEPCNITSGATGGTTGAAGQVYVLGKNKAGFQICHVLNLTGVSSNDWTDLNGTKEKPTVQTNIAMKMYYYGNAVVSGTNKLWWASPDYANGAAQLLSYTTGSDAQGNFVTFSVPSLAYWDMIALETSLTDTNLSIDARQPIRGGWYEVASAGVSSAGTYTSASCCSRYAGYKAVQFGSTAASKVKVKYTASSGVAGITFHLGSATGPAIGSCLLLNGTKVTVTCPIAPTTGLRDIYVTFDQGLVNLYSFYFVT